jgi:glyoxalase family protein
MTHELPGIHHVTAIASDPQENVDFYGGLLGLRLVKKTVNFDDPGSYHLYYGDGVGTPGTIMTFFAWPGAPRGRQGTGQVGVTSFAVPGASLDWWRARLQEHGVEAAPGEVVFGEEGLAFTDPDGIRLALVGAGDERSGWADGAVPGVHAIRGFHGVSVSVVRAEPTARLLVDTLGFEAVGEQGGRARYAAAGRGPASIVDVIEEAGRTHGQTAGGTVHHVAWRTPDDASQLEWRELVGQAGRDVTPVLDRNYFHSIYFREPGGVLFEIATDPPGFAVDESVERLGTGLKLPPWYESDRYEIERALPPLEAPRERRWAIR